jgi:hypothetical protein
MRNQKKIELNEVIQLDVDGNGNSIYIKVKLNFH